MKLFNRLAMLALSLILALTLTACSQEADAAEPAVTPEPTAAPAPREPVELADASQTLKLGGRMCDFTVTTYDGKTVTLSELLQTKDAVLINIWATWCGPCRAEFPFMQAAYKEYSDKVAVVALSCDANDDDAALKAFAQELKLTFSVARDTVGMAQKLRASSIPTSIVVDRFGTICFWMSGAITEADSFTRLFDAFVGEEYTESTVWNGIPPEAPTVEPAASAELAAALNPDCESCAQTMPADALSVKKATNPKGKYVWPFAVTTDGDHTVIASTNTGVDNSTSEVSATLTAQAGDAILVTFKTSTEAARDLLQIAVNGETVKVFSGEHKWTTYAIPVEAKGDHTVTLSYIKNASGKSGKDMVWIDTLALATGDAAAAALAANPVTPVAEEIALTVTNETAREIVFADENGLLAASFGPAKYYIVNDDKANILATVTADVDPESAFLYSYYDNKFTALSACMTDAGYELTTGVDSAAATGYTYTYAALVPDSRGSELILTVFFRDEENLNAFVRNNSLGEWAYADEAAAARSILCTVKYVDQDGNPVPGVTLQACTETECQLFTTDDNGLCSLNLAPGAWELHTLVLPEGYEGDLETVTPVPAEGGEITISLNRL